MNKQVYRKSKEFLCQYREYKKTYRIKEDDDSKILLFSSIFHMQKLVKINPYNQNGYNNNDDNKTEMG